MNRNFWKMTLVLGLMNTIGPFATDMYLPAFPRIASEFSTSAASVQITLTTYFLAFSIAQLFFGPASDMYGRKPPIYVGLVLLIASSIGCAFAPSIEILTVLRFFQGIAAAGVLAIPRAVIRDCYTGVKATQLMGTMMLVSSVAPMLAPMIGSFLIIPFGWRSVFVLFSVISVLILFLHTFFLPETLAPENRKPFSPSSLLESLVFLFRDRSFLGFTLIGGLGMAGLFAFIGNASFVYMTHFGLTPLQFGLAFGVNAVGLMVANQFSATMMARLGSVRLIRLATACYAGLAVLLLVLFLVGVDSFWIMAGLLMVVNMFFGFFSPAAAVLTLEEHGRMAGAAASLSGTLQMLMATFAMTLGGVLFNGTPIPMLSVIAASAVLAFVLAIVTTRGLRVAPSAAGAGKR